MSPKLSKGMIFPYENPHRIFNKHELYVARDINLLYVVVVVLFVPFRVFSWLLFFRTSKELISIKIIDKKNIAVELKI